VILCCRAGLCRLGRPGWESRLCHSPFSNGLVGCHSYDVSGTHIVLHRHYRNKIDWRYSSSFATYSLTGYNKPAVQLANYPQISIMAYAMSRAASPSPRARRAVDKIQTLSMYADAAYTMGRMQSLCMPVPTRKTPSQMLERTRRGDVRLERVEALRRHSDAVRGYHHQESDTTE
jgi:hypothetical protein